MPRTVEQIQFAPRMPKPLRVAAYARVSSGKDAMLHSLAAQVDHYSTYIRHHHGWEYVGVYADEAKTGTRDSRENFQRMLTDCRARKIDHIITKSISRFSRNTVTLLETVRELKELSISVYFEEQSIDTATADGELMLSILASYAQEESLSASENQKWRVKRNFEEGIPPSSSLGNGSKLRWNWNGAKTAATGTIRPAPSPGRSSAPTAAIFSVPRPGTPPTATAVLFGNATANSKENTNAKHPI